MIVAAIDHRHASDLQRLGVVASLIDKRIMTCGVDERRRQTGDPDFLPGKTILFGQKEGRIAKANRGKDPLYMFAALQRHLNYPVVPRLRATLGPEKDFPALQAKVAQLEKRLLLVESELKGNLDLSQYYVKPVEPPPELP